MESGLQCKKIVYNQDYRSYDPTLFKTDDYKNLNQYVRTGISFGRYEGELAILKLEDRQIPHHIPKPKIVINCSEQIYHKILEKNFSCYADFLARNLLNFLSRNSSALIFSSATMRLNIAISFILLLLALLYSGVLWFAMNLLSILQYCFKVFVFICGVTDRKSHNYDNIEWNTLPHYTILVPLYREAGKISSIMHALYSLNYPKNKLDVKLVVEEEDVQTIRAIGLHTLQNHCHVVIVPNSKPKTKPKACNYALNFALGDYIVVYDAEDRPEPNQLLKSVSYFRNLPEEYICLQARLEIDEPKSLLGALFKIEYDIWFRFMLKGLCCASLPITLGGTSNHFKTEELKKIGGWDAYNVTEDAELGIRLNIMGYKVCMLDSSTIEDPPISLVSWLTQRIRWIKGFFITYIGFLLKNKVNQSLGNQLSIMLLVGFASVNFLTFPILIFNYINNTHIDSLSSMIVIMHFLFSWISYYLSICTSAGGQGKASYFLALIFPFYFLLHSIAAYCALCEMIIAPYKWNKTDHNIS